MDLEGSEGFKMPFSSMYPDIEIPDIDLWGLMFEKEREEKFPYDQSKSTWYCYSDTFEVDSDINIL